MSEELDLFVKYAGAFEEAFTADNWEIVASCFDQDITWAVAGLPSHLQYQGQGRSNTADALKMIARDFDRRFDTRVPQITKRPIAIPSGIHFEFVVTYTRAGLPPLQLQGEEWDVFRDGKIAMHYEVMHNRMEVEDYLREHDALLLPVA